MTKCVLILFIVLLALMTNQGQYGAQGKFGLIKWKNSNGHKTPVWKEIFTDWFWRKRVYRLSQYTH